MFFDVTMNKTRNSLKLLLIALSILIFSSCARTPALTSSIPSGDTSKPADMAEVTASSDPNILLSATEHNPTYLAAEQSVAKQAKSSLIKSIKEVYNLKKAIKSNSVKPKSENYKAPKKSNNYSAAIKIFFGIILILLGVAGLIFTLFPHSIITLSVNISFPIAVLIAMLSGFSIVGGIGLIITGTAH